VSHERCKFLDWPLLASQDGLCCMELFNLWNCDITFIQLFLPVKELFQICNRNLSTFISFNTLWHYTHTHTPITFIVLSIINLEIFCNCWSFQCTAVSIYFCGPQTTPDSFKLFWIRQLLIFHVKLNGHRTELVLCVCVCVYFLFI
jgi:hypothetical protein